MNIGIDIDDTTFLTVKSMLKYADIFEEEISGVPTNRDSFGLIKNRYYLKALYGWDDKTKFEFFDKYYKNVLEECTMLPNADKTIQKLKEEVSNLDTANEEERAEFIKELEQLYREGKLNPEEYRIIEELLLKKG